MKICVFEDEEFAQLYPLVYLRPIFELRCGATSLYEKIRRNYDDIGISFFIRPQLVNSFKRKNPQFSVNNSDDLKNDDFLLLNARLLLKEKISPASEEIGIKDDAVAYINIKKETINKVDFSDFSEFLKNVLQILPQKEVDLKLISYPWDLINENGEAIKDDFNALGKKGVEGKMDSQALIYGNQDNLYVAKGVKIHPFVVLDVKEGPIIVEENAELFPFARIEGPGVIGKDSIILGGAKIRECTSIGPVCRVGGEVEESIIHGYSNKYHDGFLGHAYVCEWVNLGAFTTNSDLKNDYSAVSVYIKGELIDSKSTKVGSFIGDHTKTSIGTILNTGTVIGVMCNVVGSGKISPKFIPSFAWYLNNNFLKYSLRMQLETAKMAVSRRKKELTQEDIELLKYVHQVTKEERLTAVRKSSM